MNASELEALLDRYYEGETTLAEEQQLRGYFQNTAPEDVPPALRGYAAQFHYPQQVKAQRAEQQEWEEWLATYQRTPKRGNVVQRWLGLSPVWQVAASIVLVLAGFGGGLWYEQRNNPPGSATLVTTETIPAVAAKQLLRVSRVEQTSASERISAVRQTARLSRADEELLGILVHTLNFDDNVNVRLAACEALYHFADAPGVREAFIQSLKVQTDPSLQIALLDVLTALQEKRALEEMQRISQDAEALEIVRLRAQQSIGQLI